MIKVICELCGNEEDKDLGNNMYYYHDNVEATLCSGCIDSYSKERTAENKRHDEELEKLSIKYKLK